MDNENEFNYSFDNQFKKAKTPHKSGFSKTVFIPFISGILGASLVVGICFGVPQIKSKLIENTNTSIPTFSTQTKQEANINSNNLFISL